LNASKYSTVNKFRVANGNVKSQFKLFDNFHIIIDITNNRRMQQQEQQELGKQLEMRMCRALLSEVLQM